MYVRSDFIRHVKRYFVASHTGKGFVNFLDSNLNEMKVVLVSHPSLTVKTKIFQKLLKLLSNNGEKVELLLNRHSQSYLDGFIMREKSLAIIGDQIATDGIKYLNIFKFGQSIDISKKENEIKELIDQAYHYLAESLSAHEAIEKYYIQAMNFKRSDELIEQVKKELFEEIPVGEIKQGETFQRLFDSNMLSDDVELVPELLRSVNQRYFIQGGPGTGKSVFMRKILNRCLKSGYDVEQYMCSYDPNSTDMIIIHDLNVCMLDSSGPHKYTRLSSEDKVIDLYKTSGTMDVAKKYERDISRLRSEQQTARNRANTLLKKAGQQLESVEALFETAVDETTIHEKSLTIKQTLS